MKSLSRRSALAAGIFAAAVLWGGCPKKEKPSRPPAELYNEAISFMTKGKGGDILNPPDYEKARETFQEILYEHPTSRYAPVAELRIADTYYEAGDWEGFAAMADRIGLDEEKVPVYYLDAVGWADSYHGI